jgi:hypothetical protein
MRSERSIKDTLLFGLPPIHPTEQGFKINLFNKYKQKEKKFQAVFFIFKTIYWIWEKIIW